MKLLRDIVVVGMIAAGLLAVLEAGVRVFAPQHTTLHVEEGGGLAVEDVRLGHRLRPEVRARHAGPEFEASYSIGPEGRRSAPEAVPPRPGALRVLLLGDSFTFGIGVEAADLWATVLGAALRQAGYEVHVINAGVPGYDTRAEVLALETLWDEVAPDLVILTFLPNDLFTNTPDSVAATRTIVRTDEKAPPRLHLVALAQQMLLRSDRLYCALYRRTARRDFFEAPPPPHVAVQLETTVDWLTRAQAFSEARGVPLVVFSIPQQVQVLVAAGRCPAGTFDAGAPDRHLLGRMAATRVPWITTLDTLAQAARQPHSALYFRRDGHLTPAGHHVVGRYLAREMLRRGVLPPRPHARVDSLNGR